MSVQDFHHGDFTIQGPTQDHNEPCKYIDEITVLGVSTGLVQSVYSQWAASYEQDVARLNYKPYVLAAQELAVVLGDRKDAQILDCAAGTGLVGMEVSTKRVKVQFRK